jgi:arylsulfatase A-like enzyme
MKPNIVFILSDDQGAWALGCSGNSEVITPNIDSLAHSGIRFNNFFCTSPVCSPARASILTGKIPSQHGVHDWIRKGNIDSPKGGLWGKDRPVEYLQGHECYTDYLSEAGYECGISGKWHLGASHLPQKGFSSWNVYAFGGGEYFSYSMCVDGKVEDREKYVTDEITDGAVEFLDSRRENASPFYLSVHYTAPHSPWNEKNHPDEFLDLYRDCEFKSTPNLSVHPDQLSSAPIGDTPHKRFENLTGYYAAITAMDKGVGKIIDKVKSIGEFENTLFIFTSDNGMNMGHHGVWGKGNGTFPLNMYDTSVKVPMIMSMPSALPKGEVEEGMFSQYDIMPTLLDYLEIKYDGAGKPGRSFAPLLRGEKISKENEEVVIFDEYGPVRMIRTDKWKYVHRYPYGEHELYDLANDCDENFNLLAADPTEEIKQKTNELRGRLESWFLKYTDKENDGRHFAVKGRGQLNTLSAIRNGEEVFAGELYNQ